MRTVAKLAVMGLFAALLGAPSSALASSQTWTVDDASGAAPTADGICDASPAAGLQCTLPEAVTEANALSHTDTIHFSLPPGTTIALEQNVTIEPTQPMVIDGCNGAAATAPCVGIDATAVNTTPFGVFADPVTISGLAIGNASPEAIFLPGNGSGLTVRNSWFGITILGAPAGAGAGLDLRGTGATIGGTAPGDRNVFANGAGEIRIQGGTNNRIAGNYFGVAPDGVTPEPTLVAPSIRIFNGATNATGNVIGGNTPESENLISNTGAPAVPAICVEGQGQNGNSILRNRGSGNAGIFLDLTPPDGFGNDALTGPNAGIQTPIVVATPGTLSGTAVPGGTVRVYQSDGAGGFVGFVASATADGSGAWTGSCPSATCAAEPAEGTPLTANQTDVSGNSSEFSGDVGYAHSVPVPVPPTATPIGTTPPTGQRAAAKKRCKKKFRHSAEKRRKCLRKARSLPV